jgi:hypothetical protein
MKRSISMAVALVVGLAVSSPALAARADARQARQQGRIAQGVASGQLTRGEAVRLQAQHMALQREVARARADDGGLGPREKARIERHQDGLSRRICKQKHDAQRR